MDLTNYPAVPPPPGVIPNFIDPENRAPLVIVFSAISLGLMVPILVVRLYTKVWVLHSAGWDDASALFAGVWLALCTVYTALVIWGMKVLGPHGWDIRASAVTNQWSEATVINEILFGPSAFFAKLSIFLLYLRIFGPNKLFRYVTCAGIAIIFAFYTATTVMPAVLCIRRPSETWLESQVTPRCTRNSSPLAYSQGIFGVISNLFIYLLPLRVIWQLQMPLRRKIGVSAIFATGSLAVLASMLGLYYRILDTKGRDPFWVLPPALLLAVVELNVEIICGSMPAVAGLFHHHKITVSVPSSIRNLFSRYANHSSKSRGDINMKSFKRDGYAPMDNVIPVETKILGSKEGDDKILQPGNVNSQWPPPLSSSESGMPTQREGWE